MAYRTSEACEVCGKSRIEFCPRCKAQVCVETHGVVAGARHCSICEDELVEELESAQIVFDARERDFSLPRMAFWSDVVARVDLALTRRRIRRMFARRSPEMIQRARMQRRA